MRFFEFEDSSPREYLKSSCVDSYNIVGDNQISSEAVGVENVQSNPENIHSVSENIQSTNGNHVPSAENVDSESDVKEVPHYIKYSQTQENEYSEVDVIFISDDEEGEVIDLVEYDEVDDGEEAEEEQDQHQDQNPSVSNEVVADDSSSEKDWIDLRTDDEEDESDVEFLFENKAPKRHISNKTKRKSKRRARDSAAVNKKPKALPSPFSSPVLGPVSRPRRFSSPGLHHVHRPYPVSRPKPKKRPVKKTPRTFRVVKKVQINGLPYTPGMDPTIQCNRCHGALIGDKKLYPLQQRVYSKIDVVHCLGCARLLSIPFDKDEERDMLRWLVTGVIPDYDDPLFLNNEDMKYRLECRQAAMRERCIRAKCNASMLVSVKDLENLCVKSNFKCAITGWTVPWHDLRKRRLPYWALTIDHIFPLHESKGDPAAWSVNNLQLMSSALNFIKGHYSDEEVKGWYYRFMQASYVDLL